MGRKGPPHCQPALLCRNTTIHLFSELGKSKHPDGYLNSTEQLKYLNRRPPSSPAKACYLGFLFTLTPPCTTILANGVTEIKNWQRQHLQQVL